LMATKQAQFLCLFSSWVVGVQLSVMPSTVHNSDSVYFGQRLDGVSLGLRGMRDNVGCHAPDRNSHADEIHTEE
jgi:hypothetical protein